MSEEQNMPEKEQVDSTEAPEDIMEMNGAHDEAEDTEEIELTDEPGEKGETSRGETPINTQIEAAKAESDKNLAGWQRTLAEFQNYKRRVEREQQDMKERIALETLTKILPIIDDFERAMENVPNELKDNPWMNGVSLIQGKFAKLLENHDVVVLDPVGEAFDPNRHQAISKDDSDQYESDHVIETLQKGYVSGNTLLRPALVRVAN